MTTPAASPPMDAERRRESLIDTFASWALEGMEPTAEDIRLGREYIAGRITPAEIVQQTLDAYRATN
jgi:hypothetical protein